MKYRNIREKIERKRKQEENKKFDNIVEIKLQNCLCIKRQKYYFLRYLVTGISPNVTCYYKLQLKKIKSNLLNRSE